METVTVSKLTETLLNILLGGFGLVCLSVATNIIQTIINDHKHEKREQRKAAQDDEYHQKRMKELDR